VFNGTSTQFRSLVPSLTRKAGTESPTVKESRCYINLANAIGDDEVPDEEAGNKVTSVVDDSSTDECSAMNTL